jgi:hypothetical protein
MCTVTLTEDINCCIGTVVLNEKMLLCNVQLEHDLAYQKLLCTVQL